MNYASERLEYAPEHFLVNIDVQRAYIKFHGPILRYNGRALTRYEQRHTIFFSLRQLTYNRHAEYSLARETDGLLNRVDISKFNISYAFRTFCTWVCYKTNVSYFAHRRKKILQISGPYAIRQLHTEYSALIAFLGR